MPPMSTTRWQLRAPPNRHGPRGRPSLAATSCASSRFSCANVARRPRRSSSRRPASRRSSRSVRRTPPSRWGSSSRERVAVRTAARRPRAWRTEPCSRLRQPLGVAALIMSFNTPLPNVAWKAFPAIFCGNAAVVKPSEHTPASASFFAQLALEAGVPARGAQRRARARRGGGRATRRASRRRSRQLHRFRRDRARDQRGRGATPCEDLPRARWQERARRLRRRGPRQRRSLGARVRVLERGAALRVREPDRRVRARSTRTSASGS